MEANIKKDARNVRSVLTMLEDLKETWEEALMKLLKEYQSAHPDDDDLKAVKNMNVKDLNGLKDVQTVQTVPQQTSVAPTPNKAGGLNIAG